MRANLQVGQYVLERRLGEGGMAEVWLGRHIHIGTPVAIKFLNLGLAGVADIEERFRNEGRRQGSLNHPNILKVYGFEVVDNRSYLILQYVDGPSLADILHHGPIPPAEAARIAISVLNALDYAHEHGVIHRDIKPSNILTDRNGFPYLCDFGIALATDDRRLTRTGTALGTALYMSPEQIDAPSTVTRRSDIYSFGCVLFEMLTGRTPFSAPHGEGDTDFAIKLAHLRQPPPPLTHFNPLISPLLESAVLKCLEKKPEDRFATCQELRDAVTAAMVGRSYTPTPPPPPPPPPPQPSTRPRWVWPVAIGMALIAIIVAIVLINRHNEDERRRQADERVRQAEIERQHQADLERQRQADAEREAQQRRDQAARDAEQKQQAEEADVAAAKKAAEEEHDKQERLRGVDNNHYSISFRNNCGEKLSLVATYKDLDDKWVTMGWWSVPANSHLDNVLFSKNSIFFYFAHTNSREFNGNSDAQAIDRDIVDNAFAYLDPGPALGRNKRSMKLFRVQYPLVFGGYTQPFSCN